MEMIFVFGGAYQGKTEYAMKAFGKASVCDVSEAGEPDFTKEIIAGLEGFAARLSAAGEDPADWFRARREQWPDKVLIATDISQGVVPVNQQLRAAREASGRLMIYLAAEAEQVHRVFCGIGKRIR